MSWRRIWKSFAHFYQMWECIVQPWPSLRVFSCQVFARLDHIHKYHGSLFLDQSSIAILINSAGYPISRDIGHEIGSSTCPGIGADFFHRKVFISLVTAGRHPSHEMAWFTWDYSPRTLFGPLSGNYLNCQYSKYLQPARNHLRLPPHIIGTYPQSYSTRSPELVCQAWIFNQLAGASTMEAST